MAPENVTETPLSLGPQPLASLSGSDQTKSHKSPNKLYYFKKLFFGYNNCQK
jgi:hypothetical protein